MPTKPKTHNQKLKEDKRFSFMFKNKDYEQKRGTAAQRGYSSAWQKARLGYLKKHPLCVYCMKENRTILATVVDHIIPHQGDKKLFWDSSNWQPLCETCHNSTKKKEENQIKKEKE